MNKNLEKGVSIMKIKQVKYDEKIGNLFEAEKINDDLLLKEKGELFNGKLELVYDDGSIQSEGIVENGLKEGVWKTYSKTGLLESTEEIKKGKLDGKYREFYENGNLKLEIDFVKGKQDGKFKLFYETGELQIEGIMKDNIHHGDYKLFYKSGKLHQEVNYINNLMEGKRLEYYESGNLKTEAEYFNGELNGKTVYYFENGKIESEGEYKNDKKEGEWKVYYENTGELKIRYSEENGIINGKYILYYPSFEVPYELRIKNKEKNFIKSESIIVDGVLEGEYRSYFSNGAKKEEGFYKDGKKIGKWNYFSEKHSFIVIKEILYENGEEIEKRQYDDKRNLISYSYLKENQYYKKEYNKNGNIISETIYRKNIVTGDLRRYEEIKYNETGNITYKKNYGKRFLEGDDPEYNLIVNEKDEELNSKKTEISEQIKDTKPELTQEQIAKKEADKRFDETRNWLGSRTERTLYKGSVFPVSRFIERIKDFDTDLKERIYRFIDSYTKDWISTITFDTGETYELEEALKKFREIMGLPKEEK